MRSNVGRCPGEGVRRDAGPRKEPTSSCRRPAISRTAFFHLQAIGETPEDQEIKRYLDALFAPDKLSHGSEEQPAADLPRTQEPRTRTCVDPPTSVGRPAT